MSKLSDVMVLSLIIVALTTGYAIGLWWGVPDKITVELDYGDNVLEVFRSLNASERLPYIHEKETKTNIEWG